MYRYFEPRDDFFKTSLLKNVINLAFGLIVSFEKKLSQKQLLW